MQHGVFEQFVAHQVEQRLQLLATLDHPTRQGLPWDVDAVAAEHLFEAVQRDAVGVLGGQQHRQHAGAGQALLDQLCRLVGGDRRGFTGLAGIGLADVADDPHLHRDDLQLLAGLLADHLLAGTAGAGALMLGQLMDDLHTRQVGRQRLAFATAIDRRNDFFGFGFGFAWRSGRFDQLFDLVEHGQLRRVGIFRAALGLGREQLVAQQGDLFLKLFYASIFRRRLFTGQQQ